MRRAIISRVLLLRVSGVDLPPFYSAGLVPRAAGGAGLLLTGIDGKVQLVENGALKPVAGTRDWGSDFAVLRSGCGAGTQVIASGSGEAASDSLRAYEIPAQEAVAVSAPLAMDGTVTALWTAPDGKERAGGGAKRSRRIRGGPCYGALQLASLVAALSLPAMARTRPHYGGTLRVEIEGDPWQRPDGPARRLVYDGLTQLDPTGARAARAGVDLGTGQQQSSLAVSAAGRACIFSDGSSVTSVSGGGIADGFVRGAMPVDRGAGCGAARWFLQATRRCRTCRRCWRAISI